MSSKEVEISIVTPVYNTDPLWLEQLRASVSTQTFRDYEWLLIDDGTSRQETLLMLERLCKEEPFVRKLVHVSNKGLPAARNFGVQNAKGKFIFFIDGDDLMETTCLEKLWLCLQANPLVAFANSYVHGFGSQDYYWKGGFHERDLFLDENRNTSCFLARKEVMLEVAFDESLRSGGEDWDFWLHVGSRGHWGITVPEFLFHYRRGSGGQWDVLKNPDELRRFRELLQTRYGINFRMAAKTCADSNESWLHDSIKIPKLSDSSLDNSRQILFLIPWMETGGADQFNINLMAGLVRDGWKVTVATTERAANSLEKQFREYSMDIFHLPNLGPHASFDELTAYLIRTRKPSHVFLCNSMAGYHLLPSIKTRFPEVAVVDYLHCEDPGWFEGGYPTFSRLFSAFIDRTYVTSRQLQDDCIKKGRSAAELETLYIGVDTTQIRKNEANRQKIRLAKGWDEDTPVILYVARLTAQKRPDRLIRILTETLKQTSHFRCVIIGDGPERMALDEAVKKSKLQQWVLTLGDLNNEAVLQWMDAADIFILPSQYEGIALSIYEAMAKSLPVIAADTGGQKELVTPATGRLISTGSTESGTTNDYVRELTGLLESASLRKEWGGNARSRVLSLFTLEKTMDQFLYSLNSLTIKKATQEDLLKVYQLIYQRMHHAERNLEFWQGTADARSVRFLTRHQRTFNRIKKLIRFFKRVTG